MKLRLPWRATRFGTVSNTLILRPARRLWLRRVLQAQPGREDITVVIPIRNRSGQAVRNTLSALRRQTYPRDLIHIEIVDYNSDAATLARLQEFATEFGAVITRVADVSEWNRPHCLNVAIARCTSRYAMALDADIVLAPDYLQCAVEELRRDPLQVLMNQCLDLPEHVTMAAESITMDLLLTLRPQAAARTDGLHHQGTIIAPTELFRRIRGYDENFREWGADDNDVVQRLERFAADQGTLFWKTFYLHQWHPQFDGADPDMIRRQFRANWAYLARVQHTLVRNPNRWGGQTPDLTTQPATLQQTD